MKNIILVFIIMFFASCGGGGGGGGAFFVTDSSTDDRKIVTYDKTTLADDEMSKYQWHRTNMNLDNINLSYLGYNSGTPIIVQVADDGIDSNHEDLKGNINLISSYNVSNDSNDPSPDNLYIDSHGTAVAGIIAAVGYNNIGIKGIAPSAQLAGFTFSSSGNSFSMTLGDLDKAWLSGDNANNIAVSNNSWGSCIDKEVDEELILKSGSELLRDAKGRIYVFAAGNGRTGDSSCPGAYSYPNSATSNASYLLNSQYSIAVAAVNSDNKVAYYSSPGSNILISAYSGGLITDGITTTIPEGTGTMATWSEDTEGSYTNSFSGTSASAPIVSGSIALVLEACPNLTYRDVKYLLAKNATKIDITNTSWITNNAGWSYSNDYGFGLINLEDMINECKTTYVNLPNLQTTSGTINVSDPLSTATTTKIINIGTSLTIEWVGLTVTTNFDLPESLQIKLISPNGTESELLHFDNQFGSSTSSFLTSGFRFSSQAFLDEDSSGDWYIEITSNNGAGVGTINNLDLEIVGH